MFLLKGSMPLFIFLSFAMQAHAVTPETQNQEFHERACKAHKELHKMAEGSVRFQRARAFTPGRASSVTLEDEINRLTNAWDIITFLKSEEKHAQENPGQKSSIDNFGLIAPYLSTEELLELTSRSTVLKYVALSALSKVETEASFSKADLTREQCHGLFREPPREIGDHQEHLDEGGLFAQFSKVKFSRIKMDPMCFSELPGTLKELTIENIKLNSSDDQQMNYREIWVEILQNIIDRAPTLEVLRIEFSFDERNHLGAESVQLIAHRMGSLKELSLVSAAIGPQGARALVNGNLQGLRKLRLTHSQLGSTGASEIAGGNFSELSYLDLSANSIESRGVTALANGNLQSLRELILTGNNLGQVSASAIAGGNFLELRYLNLNHNSIGRAGALALAHGNLKKLTHLFLQENKVEGNISDLCRLLRKNLQHLEILSCGDRRKHKPGV